MCFTKQQNPDSTCSTKQTKTRLHVRPTKQQNPDSTCVPQDKQNPDSRVSHKTNKIQTHVCPTKTTSRFSTKMRTTQTLTCVVRSKKEVHQAFHKSTVSVSTTISGVKSLECRQLWCTDFEHGTRLATCIGCARIRLHRRHSPHEIPS